MRELAVCVQNDNKNVSVFDTIDAIKNAGFKNVFIQWYNESWEYSQEEQLKYIKDCDLNVIFAHLGYQNINDLWLDNDEGKKIVDRYKNDIKVCKDNDIPLVVMHLMRGDNPPIYNQLGLNRVEEIVEYAEDLGINISFENTKTKGYLEYIFDNIKSDNIGLCFDSGHYHAHFKDEFDFDKYKNKIFAVHLHDNDATSDQHLTPFDGTLDWDKVIYNLKKCNYNGPITMELCYRKDYLNCSIEDFYKEAYKVGNKIKDMFDKIVKE